jgi:hypothetical protein
MIHAREQDDVDHSRAVALGFVAIIALSGMLTVGRMTAAQEADPLAGVTVQSIGVVEPADNPGQALVLLRLTLEPGVTIAEHHHPGGVALYVESASSPPPLRWVPVW